MFDSHLLLLYKRRQRIIISLRAQEVTMPTQEEINDGQKKINGQLCRVDWRLIEALKLISGVLKQVAAAKAADGTKLVDLDPAALNRLIDEAGRISAVVADIIPPGCEPHNQTS